MKQYLGWENLKTLPSRSYRCGFCGREIASEKGILAIWPKSGISDPRAWLYACHHCSRPTFFDDDGTQIPGTTYGDSVKDITDTSVAQMYEEARRAFGASAYTGSVLCCRKLLMHIAVSKGAEQGQPFSSYVDHLAAMNYVPPDAKAWVDHIRTKGNEANHEIRLASREEAEELISFSEMLLKVIFEFPAAVQKRMNASAQRSGAGSVPSPPA